MHGNTPSWKETAFLQELCEAAEMIDRWTPSQRKTYLKNLLRREKTQGKTLSRKLIKLTLVDSKGRKRFIRLFKAGEL